MFDRCPLRAGPGEVPGLACRVTAEAVSPRAAVQFGFQALELHGHGSPGGPLFVQAGLQHLDRGRQLGCGNRELFDPVTENLDDSTRGAWTDDVIKLATKLRVHASCQTKSPQAGELFLLMSGGLLNVRKHIQYLRRQLRLGHLRHASTATAARRLHIFTATAARVLRSTANLNPNCTRAIRLAADRT